MLGRIECDRCQKGANSIALKHSGRNSVGPRFFVLTREVRSICVSADERSFLEGETQWEGQGNRLGMSQEDLRQIFEFVVYSVLDR